MTAMRNQADAGIRSLSFAADYAVLSRAYQWIDAWPDREVVGLEAPRRVLAEVRQKGVPMRFYNALDEPDLHRRFAALEPTEDAIATFASEFGPLNLSLAEPPLIPPSNDAGWWLTANQSVYAEPESTSAWEDEIERMRCLVDTWDAVLAEDDRLRQYVQPRRQGRELLCWPPPRGLSWGWPSLRDGEWPPRALLEPYSISISRDDGHDADLLELRASVAWEAVTLRVSEDLGRLTQLRGANVKRLQLVPRSMLGVAYAAFMLELTREGEARGPICQECGRLIVDAQRSSKRYCDERCKARAKARRGRASAQHGDLTHA